MKSPRSKIPHGKSEIIFEDISSLFLTLMWKEVILQILERYLLLLHCILVKIVVFYCLFMKIEKGCRCCLYSWGTVASIICDLQTKKNVQRSILTFAEKHQTCREKFSWIRKYQKLHLISWIFVENIFADLALKHAKTGLWGDWKNIIRN